MKKKRTYKSRSSFKRIQSHSKVRNRSKRKKRQNKFLEILTKTLRLLILLALCIFIIYTLFKPHGKRESNAFEDRPQINNNTEQTTVEQNSIIDLTAMPKPEALDHVIRKILKNYYIKDSWIKRNKKYLNIQLPAKIPPVSIIYDIIQETKKLGLKIINSEEDLKNNRSKITIGTEKNILLTVALYNTTEAQAKKGKIAIIIDDFGYYNNDITDNFLDFKYPITLSILPGQRYSSEISQKANEMNKQVMLHLPMEPLVGNVEQNDFTIMTDMSESVILNRLNKALNSFSNLVAVNNHMGSKATADERVMNIIFKELKARKLIFVDSKTTAKSVTPDLAQKYELKFIQNSTFLERNKYEDEDYIQKKLQAAAKIANLKARVVVIGHPYKETLNVLSKELPQLESLGYEIVTIKDILN